MKKIFSLFAAVLFAGSMMAESITLTAASGFKSSYGDGTFTASEVEFAYSGVMYNGKNAPTGLASKQVMQFRKNNGELKNNTSMNIKTITVATQNDKAFTLSVGTAADALSAASDPVKTNGKYACKSNTDADTEIDVTIYTFDVEGSNYFDLLNGSAASYFAYITIELGSGEAPAVAKPAIAGEAEFFDSTEVSITCETEGAAIYYTLDGTEPTAASTKYTAAFKLNATTTVKAIAIKGEDKSKIAEKAFTAKPSYASIEALVAADVADGTLVKVAFEDVKIDSVFTIKAGNRRGIYVNVKDKTGEKDVEIYYGKDDVPAAWEVEGKVSGTIIGTWTYYTSSKVWEIIPSGDDWKWTSLTYAAPSATAISNTAVEGKAVKTITNGMLIIEKNGVKYNVMGQAIR